MSQEIEKLKELTRRLQSAQTEQEIQSLLPEIIRQQEIILAWLGGLSAGVKAISGMVTK